MQQLFSTIYKQRPGGEREHWEDWEARKNKAGREKNDSEEGSEVYQVPSIRKDKPGGYGTD